MAGTPSIPLDRDHGEPDVRRMRLAWRLLAGSFGLLGIAGVTALATGPGRPLDAIVLVLIGLAAVGALGHQRSVAALEAGRRAEVEHVARILQGLSRSASPDAIVDAIVDAIAAGTGADHTVVVRYRHDDPDDPALDATLASARPGVPSTTTRLPLSDLDPGRRVGREPVAIPMAAPLPPLGNPPLVPLRVIGSSSRGNGPRSSLVGGVAVVVDHASGAAGAPGGAAGRDRVTVRLEARARAVFGLSNTIAAPLRTSRGIVIGAIVLSRRTGDPWPASARRILQGAAVEASAALRRAESHRAAEARASTDALTGLPNRRYFDELSALLARRRRADDAVGILMVDIDHFKRINDRHGHDIGDEVLRAVARAIAGAVREGDVPARFGGEEFVVLLRNASGRAALEVAERVRAAVGGLDLSSTGVSGVSVSVGVAVQRRTEQPIASLLAEADRALYRAKRAGRDRVVAA